MGINLAEGIFLGKQEVERMNLLNKAYESGVCKLITSGNQNIAEGLFNPQKIKLSVVQKTIDNVSGLAVVINNNTYLSASEFLDKTGRLVVGRYKDSNIGVVGQTFFTGKECFLPFASLPEEYGEGRDVFVVLRLKPAVTHYESWLVSIDSSGLATFSGSSTEYIVEMFRTSQPGRQTKIKLSDGQILTAQSVNAQTGTVQFVKESGTIVAKTNMQFMFLQTVSPFTSTDPQPLYTYDTCEIVTDGEVYADDPDQGMYDDGESLPVARVWFDEGEIEKIQVLTPADLLTTEVECIDTIGYHQILSEHFSDSCIPGRAITNGSVSKNKLSFNPLGFRGIVEDHGVQTENILVEPGLCGPVYNENNPQNRRYICPTVPLGMTTVECITQPARVILKPERAASPRYEELINYFKTDGLTVHFPNTMEGQTCDSESLDIFDFYWMSRTEVVCVWTRVGLNW